MAKLKGHEEDIIRMYKEGYRIAEIAEKYGVAGTTIHRFLQKLKVVVTRQTHYKPRTSKYEGKSKRVSKYNMKERKFSPEFLANRKSMTEKYGNKIKYIKTINDPRDQKLIRNILNRAFI